ncbi:MAG: hypothetical protein RLZZ77_1094 [Bacteroidota bacterium]|jgi:antibiotic biosynthesis monooxygenase (ABM) superfamily enzyme
MPKKWKLAILIWMAIYPSITVLFLVLSPLMTDWPPYARTLVLTLILVPLMVFVFLPLIHKYFHHWLRK